MNVSVDMMQKCRETLQAFADMVFILDEHGAILDYGSGDPSLPVPSLDNLLNKKIQDILSSEQAHGLEDELRKIWRGDKIIPLEFSLSISGRERWFDARLAANSSSQLVLSARDITKYKETEVRMKRQLQQLSALRSIDLAIASGLDLNLLLSMLLDRITTLLQVDAAAVLLLAHETNTLKFAAGKGFHTNISQHTRFKLGEGLVGRVALGRQLINVSDLTENDGEYSRSPLFADEKFIAYYGVPLLAKGRVLGVLEIFHRSHLNADNDWLEFLNIISGQAAIAIDSAAMFQELQRSNIELSMAYSATIDGWSRTLDLRDKETEGHTRRVADITVRMATSMGIDDSEIVHIRRGAILHDIGKVAIPDRIMFKPGPLTNDEWEVMRQHPRIAVELLSPISYLSSSLEIPHWHHEKWNGTGYPDRLGGENIPFSARLFALADVYDALTSDRPYRKAWSKKDAIQYISNQSGKHFDPSLVPDFLKLISANGFDARLS